MVAFTEKCPSFLFFSVFGGKPVSRGGLVTGEFAIGAKSTQSAFSVFLFQQELGNVHPLPTQDSSRFHARRTFSTTRNLPALPGDWQSFTVP